MTVSASELLACAEAFAAEVGDEAKVRACISRAYYAAFHAAREFHTALPTPGHPGAQGGMHQELIDRLVKPSLSKEHAQYSPSRQVGYILRGMRVSRVKADYDLEETIKQAEALQTVEDAKRLVLLATGKSTASAAA